MLELQSQVYSGGLELPDGKVLRNLEAQVEKNKEDIAAHYNRDRVLADFGIRVIGQISSADDLPDPSTFSGDYGDAYAVGASDPYSFYIWTRADIDAGHPEDYWFDIGPLAIVGPQGPIGPQGPQGETGERGNTWYTGTSIPSNISGSKEGDLYLNTITGMVYKYTDAHWYQIRSIKGPQGIQGPQGPQGEQGERGLQGIQGPTGKPGFMYKTVGIVSDVSQLPPPDPTEVGDNDAYLVGQLGSYSIYIVFEGMWRNLGPISVGFPGGQNVFVAYDQYGNPIGANLYHVSVICRNFDSDTKTGLVNGCLTINIPNTYTFSGRGSLYNWLLSNGYTNAANSFYPASGFSFDRDRKYTYIGVAANPSVHGLLLFVGFREDRTEGGELKQASFSYHETDSSKANYIPQIYYDASIIPPSGTL